MAEENQVKTDEPNDHVTAGGPEVANASQDAPEAALPVGADQTDDELDDAQYERLKAQFLNPDAEIPAEEQSPPSDGGGAPTETEPSATEQAPGTGTDEPKAEPPPTPPQDAPEEEEELKPKSFRPRLDMFSEVEKEAVALRKELAQRGVDLSLKECLERVEAKYQGGETPEGAKPPGPTLDELRKQVADLRMERKAAMAESEFSKVAELDDRIESLRDEMEAARMLEREAQTRDAAQREEAHRGQIAAIEASKERALKAFPDLADPNTAITSKWQEVFERLSAAGDPIVTSPNAPEMVALLAAAELGKLPATATPAAPPAPAPAPAVAAPVAAPPTRPTIQPAPGGTRSAGPSQAGQLEALLDKVDNLDDYEALKAKALGG